jgi:PHD/YefM family antitoxin component YafN of YafNO toxin-antitoxin module
MSKMQRTKGATYERWCANKLRSVYPHAKRGIGQARSASEVPDVDGTPWWVECKHQKTLNVQAALVQADEARLACPSPHGSPLVIARRDRERDIVALYLDDFIHMASELEELKVAAEAVTAELTQVNGQLARLTTDLSTHAAFNPPGPPLPNEVGPCPHCGGNYAECGPRLRTGRSCA